MIVQNKLSYIDRQGGLQMCYRGGKTVSIYGSFATLIEIKLQEQTVISDNGRPLGYRWANLSIASNALINEVQEREVET